MSIALERPLRSKHAATAAQLPYTREALLRPRSVLQHAWNLVGVGCRLALLPDDWNRRLGWTPLEEERLRAVLPHVQGRLLDVGAGKNQLCRLHDFEAIGVDVFDFGGGAQIVEDTRRLPFPDASFDTVTFIACLNHIPYRDEALREAWRVLRPGGCLIATMIGRRLGEFGHKIWWYGEDKERGMAEGETGGLDVAEMFTLLSSTGFAEIERRRFCHRLNGLYLARKC